jgi:hypothetical protein
LAEGKGRSRRGWRCFVYICIVKDARVYSFCHHHGLHARSDRTHLRRVCVCERVTLVNIEVRLRYHGSASCAMPACRRSGEVAGACACGDRGG